ncbi:sulfur carrier protein ThiS [Bizionia argentinensis JUB59]|uniref:Sulfur carrier protein ThiS n=2 Tax=Bizionia TaxID=283785 RepID=G2EB25_9FLAO|nr:sulfur carrier protein ThiS [Bizionia argentinensis JUB59]
MTIRVNDNTLEINNDLNILQLLERLKFPTHGIAVAINENIISRELWMSKTFTENDHILIIQATQGG